MRVLIIALSVLATLSLNPAFAQDLILSVPADGAQRVFSASPAEVRMQAPPSKANPQPGAQPGAQPDKAPKEGEGKKEEGAKKEDDAGPKVIQRDAVPPSQDNPLRVTVGPDGKMQFQFRGQKWPDVLDWLADVSGMSLDWQELPGDYLNLTTQRSYSLDETRDLISRHLLARGFTLLVQDDIISVVNLEKLNPGLVPRVTPEELADRLPHEFVKVSFPLDWMLADQAAKELEPMIGPHGKLRPLTTSNRLEAMDAVVNLREIYQLLLEEQSGEQQDNLIREFALLHVRAVDVMEQLRELLGIEEEQPAMPMTPQQMQQMQQMQRQMQQQQQQNGAPPAAKEKPPVKLVANSRKNSILAHAPPDKMAIIEQAILVLDVRTERLGSLLTNPDRMQLYRLHSLDPELLITTLENSGDLDPTTRLVVDTKQSAIIAYASLADHLTIRRLVQQLDGSGRSFEVIRLRRLAADYVAGTIEFMMIGPEEKTSERPRYYYGYYPRQEEEQKSDDGFRVDADVENNLLLLWANEVEIEEVTNLLVKLGEIPPNDGSPRNLRVLNQIPPEQLRELLERLRRAWPSLSPNPLIEPPEKDLPPTPQEAPAEVLPQEASQAAKTDLQYTFWQEPDRTPLPDAEAPPVTITLGPSGELVISSRDTKALDVLEELVRQLSPAHPSYEIFRLKFADAFYVKENLEDFFSEDDEENSRGNSRYYFYDYAPPQNQESRMRLSQRPPLKFIYDYDTNSILVHHADARQLHVIRDLIDFYDQPESPDSQSARMTSVFQIQYSKAEQIADAVKDVYRDLLSSNDKALQNKNPEQNNRQPTGTTYIFNEGQEDQSPDRTPVTFKGKLSIGVDTVSNTLLVSAEGETLMRNIEEMIETLDRAAQPLSTVTVLSLGGETNAGTVRTAVAKVLAEQAVTKAAGEPATTTQPTQQPAAPGQPGANVGQ